MELQVQDGPILPFEIFNEIFEEINALQDRQERRSLLNICSRVCKAWSPHCRKWLFKDFKMNEYRILAYFLRRDNTPLPAFLTYVQSLTLYRDVIDFGGQELVNRFESGRIKFDDLRSLTLVYVEFGPQALPITFISAPFYNITRLCLTSVRFHCCHDEAEVLASFKRLEVLESSWKQVAGSTPSLDLDYPDPPSKLKKLVLCYPEDIPRCLLRKIPPALEFLVIEEPRSDIDDLLKTLADGGISLSHIDIGNAFQKGLIFHTIIPLNTHTNLRTIRMPYWGNSASHVNLRHLQHLPKLERLCLYILMPETGSESLAKLNLDDLDEFLCRLYENSRSRSHQQANSAETAGLESVEILLCLDRGSFESMYKFMVGLILEIMEGCRKKGIVSVNYQEPSTAL